MGHTRHSGKVTQKEKPKKERTKNLPPMKNHVLTEEMVRQDLNNNVNNVASNANSSADEVAKIVAKDFREYYHDDGFRAAGNAIKYRDSIVVVEKNKKGTWDADKLK